MSSLPHSASTAIRINPKLVVTDIREGDWDGYQLHSSYCCSKDFVSRHDNLNTYRQQCALAYLGKRAQLHGGVCSKTEARILTTRFLVELDASNKKQRFSRYPWLGKLVDLIAEIEREQEKTSSITNVISLVAPTK